MQLSPEFELGWIVGKAKCSAIFPRLQSKGIARSVPTNSSISIKYTRISLPSEATTPSSTSENEDELAGYCFRNQIDHFTCLVSQTSGASSHVEMVYT